ncbi:MAG: zinc-ribbon and DUF3426 domain-containing protein [Steroidobacteraceae bacterium]
MFTVCPKCALTLAVTTADLRVAQGYVRCGRCLNVFNALARLSEERPAEAPAPSAGAPAAESPQTAPASSEQAAATPDPPLPAPEPAEPSVAADVTGEIEIELDASAFLASAPAPETPAPETPATSEPASAATAVTEMQIETSDPAAALSEQTNTASEHPDGAFELEARRPRAGLVWKLGAAALVIALALQIINHYREALAASPALSGPVSAVYSALGVKIAPRWNLHAYEVRQLGASVAGATAGEIVVRASVKNSGNRAQPLPLLRVTLQDRFGNRIGARDVPPGEYLPSSVASTALLAAGSRVDATVVFVDPGPQAVGFEIDACLREQGAVACAHGP